ncbi:MAG: tryptophan 2,3-dioxygenase family protein [Cytophagales bacterium]|nr:tryptophan 2,3-dioxygenase family protein [Cytophagales bacterium]
MEKSVIDNKTLAQIEALGKKYDAMGQDLSSYLDGLLYSDYLTYWDYVHLDTLLSLQTPRTDFPDEKIFIIYHQITELYFNLILNEQQQVIDHADGKREVFLKRVRRINRYFDHLIDSFDVMLDGMDQEQFLKFRMSLLPSSGFQSGQYRKIEINSTDFYNLVPKHSKEQVNADDSIEEQYEYIYWKRGATELASGKKTLTLKQFEKKYSVEFIRQAHEVKENNIYHQYLAFYQGDAEIEEALRHFDHKTNVLWPLAHLKSTIRYLQKSPEDIKATGGTNWQKYLPPRHQGIIFFPKLWSDQEITDWGVHMKLDQ